MAKNLAAVWLVATIFCLFSVITDAEEWISYDGYKVYTILPNGNEMQKLADFYFHDQDVRFFVHMPNRSAEVLVAAEKVPEFEKYLRSFSFNYSVFHDLGKLLKEERETANLDLRNVNVEESIYFDRYNRYPEIEMYLLTQGKKYPDILTTFSAGNSFQGRNLWMVKITTPESKEVDDVKKREGETFKPAIFINAGIHGREWISPAVALYIINELVKPENRRMLENVVWYINPLSNPDGYEYSHTSDRFWRKTRSGGPICHGVDPNRNFAHHWGEGGIIGNIPCLENFQGMYPFSERETVAIRNHILNNADQIKLFVDLHSYSQLMVYPWGYTRSHHPSANEFRTLGNRVSEAISKVRGTIFDVGSTTDLQSIGTGRADDWAMGVANIPYVYTMELPPKSFGYQGYLLPPNEIRNVGYETFQGIKVFHEFIESRYALQNGKNNRIQNQEVQATEKLTTVLNEAGSV